MVRDRCRSRLIANIRTWAGTEPLGVQLVLFSWRQHLGLALQTGEWRFSESSSLCTLPGESVATYGDALNRLTDRSSYLYVEGARYWYGTQASVARRARELVEQLLTTRRDEVHG